jgi:hypothetical protein
MTGVAIDTLRYAKRLRAAGFTEAQAEVQAEALAEAVHDSFLTKDDLASAVEKLNSEIRDVQSGLRKEIQDMQIELKGSEARMRIEIRDLHTNLLRWLIPLIIGQTAVVAALVKLL